MFTIMPLRAYPENFNVWFLLLYFYVADRIAEVGQNDNIVQKTCFKDNATFKHTSFTQEG